MRANNEMKGSGVLAAIVRPQTQNHIIKGHPFSEDARIPLAMCGIIIIVITEVYIRKQIAMKQTEHSGFTLGNPQR